MEVKEIAGRVRLESPHWDSDIIGEEASPRIFVDLDADTLEQHSKPTVCTVTVRFDNDKTAVVHFSVGVRDGKVTASLNAVAEKRDIIRDVKVPKWVRRHVRGKLGAPAAQGATIKGKVGEGRAA